MASIDETEDMRKRKRKASFENTESALPEATLPEDAAEEALTEDLPAEADGLSEAETLPDGDVPAEAPQEPLDEEAAKDAEVVKGPNIKAFPETEALADEIDAEVILKTGDNITTDHIMPAGSKILPYRSNIPHLSQYCFEVVDPEFPERAKAAGRGIIVGGHNYGQGSSREHAALVPLYLGIRAVAAKSFARIHAANLVNAGILPLIFGNEADYDKIRQGDRLVLSDIHEGLKSGRITAKLMRDGEAAAEISFVTELADRQKEMLLAGGLLKYTAAGNDD